MSQPAEEIERVAIVIGAEYVRTISLSELNADVHYSKPSAPLCVFNGIPNIVTTFSGAQPIDRFSAEIHFLTLQPKTTEDATDVDVVLEAMKKLANSFYLNLIVLRAIENYTLEKSFTSNDFLIGYKMTIDLPLGTNVC